MSMLDDIKTLTSIVVSVPDDLHLGKLTLIIEQKASAEKAALAREAAALKNAVSPELEAAWGELQAKLEPLLANVSGLAALAKAHAATGITKFEAVAGEALHAVEAAIEPPSTGSAAVPTPIF